jgi:invasion protein IalB
MVNRIFTAAFLAGSICSASAPVHAQTAQGPDLVQETYRDWVVRCATPDAAQDTRICEMTQDISQAETGQRLLGLALQATESGAELSIVTPFGLRLSNGVTLAVEAGPVAKIAFRTCLPQGCIASTQLDDAALAQLGTSEAVDVLLTTDSGQTATLSVSLGGFVGAFSRLENLREQ